MLNKPLHARYYDGETSTPRAVNLRLSDTGWLESDTPYIRAHVNHITFRPPVGSAARQLILPDGSILETSDHTFITQMCETWNVHAKETLFHRLESSLKWAAIGLISLILLLVIGYLYVLPQLSYVIAMRTPASVQSILGKSAFKQMDELLFQPSQLTPSVQATIQAQFDQLKPVSTAPIQLYFRDAPIIGANALALPDGSIIVTDGLVNILGPELDISGILLHEIGHIEHRHSLQKLVRQATLSAIILTVTGDVSATSSLVLALPGVLLESSFSREFEAQSDDFALQHIDSLNLSYETFARSMELLLQTKGEPIPSPDSSDDNTKPQQDWSDYLATHPATSDRIKKIRRYAELHNH